MTAALVDFLWQLAYVGPVAAALTLGIVVLLLRRRKAPRAAVVGAATFAVVLVVNGLLWLRSEQLVYNLRNGGIVPLLVFELQIVMAAAALLHAAAVLAVTWAILADRGKPVEPPDENP